MSIKSCATVHAVGKNVFVEVSSDQAFALFGFLRQNGFHASPPSPQSTGIDRIELRRGTDAKAIMSLIKRWV